MIAHFSFSISPQMHGQTLLDCLLPAIPYLAEDRWKGLASEGLLKLDGELVDEQGLSKTMQEGQLVEYTIPDHEEGDVDTRWKLLWENDDIAAIHKPANLPVSRTTRNVYNTLIQLLRRESPWPDAHLLHRLDIETSGTILIAKNKSFASIYQTNLSQLMADKIYHTVVHGVPEWQTLDYECSLGTLPESPIRCQMHVIDADNKPDGVKAKHSHTRFTVLQSSNGFSLIECQLKTGRKHQLRAHLASLGLAIVGDKIYSNGGEFYLKRLEDALEDQDHKKLLTAHHLLHSYSVVLNNINDAGAEQQSIENNHYPDPFKNFLKQQGFDLSLLQI